MSSIKMYHIQFIVLIAIFTTCLSQRSPYAGRRPIGYPEIETPVDNTQNALGNRFGNGTSSNVTTTTQRFGNGTSSNVTTTTQRLPVEALGDRELFNRLGKLPVDKQPFWFINWQALEQNRGRPQTFDQRPNLFNEANQMLTNPSTPNVNTNNNVRDPNLNPPTINVLNSNNNFRGSNTNPPIQNEISTNNVFLRSRSSSLVQNGENSDIWRQNLNPTIENEASRNVFFAPNFNSPIQNEFDRNDNFGDQF